MFGNVLRDTFLSIRKCEGVLWHNIFVPQYIVEQTEVIVFRETKDIEFTYWHKMIRVVVI